MPRMKNQRKIDIAGIFRVKQQTMMTRVQEAAKQGEKLWESGQSSGMNDFADQVLNIIRGCALELIDSIPEAALWNQQWSEALDLAAEFVNKQGEWLFRRCLELWGEEALAVRERIEEACDGIIAEMGGKIEIAHRLKRRSLWDIKVRDSIKIPPAETAKLLIISILALVFGFLLGKWL